MNLERLIKSDLNLLVVFQILMEERSVSRAAQRMHLTQPAVSKTLKRLRDLFDDPLFSRTPHGLTPTAKAISLHEQLPDLLSKLDEFLNAAPFEPFAYKGTMRIASNDLFNLYLPVLTQILSEKAPHLRLSNAFLTEDFQHKLNDGSVDFAIHPAMPLANNAIVSHPIATGTIACFVTEEHPLADKSSLSLDDYLSHTHVKLMTNYPQKDFAIVDGELAKMGKQRNIIFESPFLGIALHTAAITNSIISGPNALNVGEYSRHNFIKLPWPQEIARPPTQLNIYHHSRVDASPAHLWLKQQLSDIIGKVYN